MNEGGIAIWFVYTISGIVGVFLLSALVYMILDGDDWDD